MWYKRLHNQIFIGIILGVIAGFILPGVMFELKFIGKLFILALKMIIAPLILSSIFVGIIGLGDIRKIGPLGRNTVIYYLSTTFMAVLIGIIVVNIIKPGIKEDTKENSFLQNSVVLEDSKKKLKNSAYTIEGLLDHDKKAYAVYNDFSNKDNLWFSVDKDDDKLLALEESFAKARFDPSISQYYANQVRQYARTLRIISSMLGKGLTVNKGDVNRAITTVSKKTGLKEAILDLVSKGLMNPFKSFAEGNSIGIICFALLLGAFATTIAGKSGEFVINFMVGFNEIMFKIVDLVIRAAPVGIFSLIGTLIAENAGDGKLMALFSNVSAYMLSVIAGLAVHAFLVLPLVLLFLGKMSPFRFFMGMRSALLTAFSTASSAATLPLTFKATQDNLKVSKKVTDFVLPLGATINMDGTALYESVAVIFIANFLGVDLSMVDQLIIFITASIAAIGAAAIPNAGLVTMTIVLSAVGLPDAAIVIIIAVDRFLDMFRTAVNVEGDAVGTVVISRFQK